MTAQIIYTGGVHGITGHVVLVRPAPAPQGSKPLTVIGKSEHGNRECEIRVHHALGKDIIAGLRRFPRVVDVDGATTPSTGADLAVALATCSHAMGDLPPIFALAELSLDGQLRPVRGALPMLRACSAALDGARVIVSHGNSHEAALVDGIDAWYADTLDDVLAGLAGGEGLHPVARCRPAMPPRPQALDLTDTIGMDLGCRALEIAAAGGHSLLLVGPPGAGKTMLARRLPGLLPTLTGEETAVLQDIASCSFGPDRVYEHPTRPFRAPHHTVSDNGLLGTDHPIPRPGEVTLAHGGVLFLDDLPEFRTRQLSALRTVLLDGRVRCRQKGEWNDMPAQPLLVAAMNPCPCGYHGYRQSTARTCQCTEQQVARYRARIDHVRDLFDLVIELPYRSPRTIRTRPPHHESSPQVAARVASARELARARGYSCNAAMPRPSWVTSDAAFRAHRVSQTIADLQDEVEGDYDHEAEARSLTVSLGA